MLAVNPRPIAAVCTHCGEAIPIGLTSQFCCSGCEGAYAWITSHKLGHYYELKSKGGELRKAHPVSGEREAFTYLDDGEFQKNYAWKDADGRWMDFYLEGVHCIACVWLTEKVAELVDNVSYIRLDLGRSVARVKVSPEGSFAQVARELQNFGYRPHPIALGERSEVEKKENRRSLFRIGVAGAIAGNIMLLAVSLYGGASGTFAASFRWLSFALFLPAITYCATPFYKSAWSAIRLKQISIDIPIVFGLLLGSIVSIANLLSGHDEIYFDSLSSLIFLLLSTRYVLKRAQQGALNASHLLSFLTPQTARAWKNGGWQELRVEQLKANDRIEVRAGECVPIDGKIVTGKSVFNTSLLTGESIPTALQTGDVVYAGTINLSAPIEIEATTTGAQSRIARIVGTIDGLLQTRAPMTQFTDGVAKYFVIAVVLLSFIAFGFAPHGDWHEGLSRALAISIVTCPCTFALATPLAFSVSLGKLAKAGILVKNAEVLERLTQVKNVFIDKTGTLTQGSLQVTVYELPQALVPLVYALELKSAHPSAKAICAALRPRVRDGLPEPQNVREILGHGILGSFGAQEIRVERSPNEENGSEIAVYANGVEAGSFVLRDQLRADASATIQKLRSLDLRVWLLSGDSKSVVDEIGEKLHIPARERRAAASPEEKAKFLEQSAPALMVGDGANDALALASAHVGVAVQGGLEVSLRAAGVYISRPGILPLYQLIVIAYETLAVIRRNLAFSLVYNSIAAFAAVEGWISPLFAAILMPLSALTVFLSTVAGTRRLRRSFREIGS